MGRIKILSNQGNGLYNAQVVYNTGTLEQERAVLLEKVSGIEEEIKKLQDQIEACLVNPPETDPPEIEPDPPIEPDPDPEEESDTDPDLEDPDPQPEAEEDPEEEPDPDPDPLPDFDPAPGQDPDPQPLPDPDPPLIDPPTGDSSIEGDVTGDEPL